MQRHIRHGRSAWLSRFRSANGVLYMPIACRIGVIVSAVNRLGAATIRSGDRTLVQASHLSPARVALLWRGAKTARAASPTPVKCAEQDASGRDHSTRRAR
jgi:hypothetical protein